MSEYARMLVYINVDTNRFLLYAMEIVNDVVRST